LESVIHQTSIASVVTLRGGAINKILLRKRDEFASLQEVSTFGRTSGGKAPARTALALILNFGDGSLSSPVPLRRSIDRGTVNSVEEWFGSDVHATSPAGELFKSLISELVKSHGKSLLLSVVVG